MTRPQLYPDLFRDRVLLEMHLARLTFAQMEDPELRRELLEAGMDVVDVYKTLRRAQELRSTILCIAGNLVGIPR